MCSAPRLGWGSGVGTVKGTRTTCHNCLVSAIYSESAPPNKPILNFSHLSFATCRLGLCSLQQGCPRKSRTRLPRTMQAASADTSLLDQPSCFSGSNDKNLAPRHQACGTKATRGTTLTRSLCTSCDALAPPPRALASRSGVGWCRWLFGWASQPAWHSAGEATGIYQCMAGRWQIQGASTDAMRRRSCFGGLYPGIFGISGISTLGISGMPGMPPDAGPCPGAPSTGSPGAPPSHDGSSTLGISIGGRPCKCRCVLHVLSGSCHAW